MSYVELAGDRKPRFIPTQVRDLGHELIEQLSLYFNPRLLGKDYRSLAGKMGLSHLEVKNLDRLDNPTEQLLNIWVCSSSEGRTVTDLIEIFAKIKRHDAINLIQKHEFQVVNNRPVSTGSSSSMVKEPVEHGVDYDTDEETNNSICSFDGFNSRSSSFSVRSRTNTGDNLMDRNQPQYPPYGVTSTLSVIDSRSNSFGTRSRTNTADDLDRSPTSCNSAFIDNEDELLRRKLDNACENDDLCHPFYGYSGFGPVGTSEVKKTNNDPEIRSNSSPISPSTYTHSKSMDTAIRANISPPSIPSEGLSSDPIIATDKIALLIGNQHYKNLEEPLIFPHKDVYDLTVALKELGFKVLSLVDLTLTEMRTIMLAYCQLLGAGVFAVFYYAGHGFEENGENYLMPVDATPEKKEEEFIKAQEFLTEMQLAETALNLVIIDACRVKGINVKNARNGSLRRSDFGNTIIAYSCQPQMPAFEACHERNGVYMNALLPRIKKNMRIEHILMEVNLAVHQNPLVVQRPMFESDAMGDCRLTTLISAEALVAHWDKRSDSWYQATTAPECQFFNREEEKINIKLEYETLFSNQLVIIVSIQNYNNIRMKLLEVILHNGSELEINRNVLGNEVAPCSDWTRVHEFRIKGLQKVVSPLLLVLQLQVELSEVVNIELKLNAEFPLISNLMNEFRKWITSENRVAIGSHMNTWV